MKTVFIVDLDGTLFDNTHRAHLIPEDKNNTHAWVEFNRACAGDKVRSDVAVIITSLLESGQKVVFLTGRGEAAKSQTESSLMSVFGREYPHLIMRPMDDHGSSAEFKRRIIKDLRRVWCNCNFLAIEDDPKVAQMFREEGVTVMIVDSRCAAVLAELQNK